MEEKYNSSAGIIILYDNDLTIMVWKYCFTNIWHFLIGRLLQWQHKVQCPVTQG